jgi:hypothetical protein
MTPKDCKSRDLDYARELIDLLPDIDRHELLIDLSMSVLERVVAWREGKLEAQSTTSLVTNDDTAWKQALKFVEAARPTRIASDSVSDAWSHEWDSAWPGGMMELVLGSRREPFFVRDELMPAYEQRAHVMVQSGSPTFSAENLEAFLEEWRLGFITDLRQIVSSK